MDVSERCFTGHYFGQLVWVVIMIACFVFGFPAFIAYSLWYMQTSHKVRVCDDQPMRDGWVDKESLARSLRSDSWFFSTFYFEANRRTRAKEGIVFVRRHRIVKGKGGTCTVRPVVARGNTNEGSEPPVRVERIMRESTNGDGKMVPVSRLDTSAVDGVFGVFYDSYEDQYYYWQTVEISRRVLQTSMVTVVKMLAPGFELPYAVAIATLSLASHSYFQPYKDQSKDELQFWVLMSNWTCLFSLFVRAHNEWDGWSFLIILLGSQGLVLTFGVMALWRAESKRVRAQLGRLKTRFTTRVLNRVSPSS